MTGSQQVDDGSALQPWMIHGERVVYDSRWVRLSLVDVEPPGSEPFEHHVVRLFRVAVAAVIDDSDRVLMLWRYRFVPGRFGWELPGGVVEDSEDPAEAAARETEEETGWRPVRPLRHLLTFQPMVGMVDSEHVVFVGRDPEKIGEPTEANEADRIEWVPLASVPELIDSGQIWNAGTLIALLRALAKGS